MKLKDAIEAVGGLSSPSKMPCYSYGISAKLCITGAKLVKVEGSVCADCYALKGMYGDWNKNVSNAHAKRAEAINKPDWVKTMVFIINAKKMEYFRWHDSGDLQNFQHLLNIVAIAEQCPNTRFWLPTREKKFVNQYAEAFGEFPKNLVVRVSATKQDEPAGNYKNTSTVHRKKEPIGVSCKAPSQGGKCLECRDCWNPRIKNVSYAYH
jgi:hypothetical protein